MWVLLTSALGAAVWLAAEFPGMFAMGAAALKDRGCFLLWQGQHSPPAEPGQQSRFVSFFIILYVLMLLLLDFIFFWHKYRKPCYAINCSRCYMKSQNMVHSPDCL